MKRAVGLACLVLMLGAGPATKPAPLKLTQKKLDHLRENATVLTAEYDKFKDLTIVRSKSHALVVDRKTGESLDYSISYSFKGRSRKEPAESLLLRLSRYGPEWSWTEVRGVDLELIDERGDRWKLKQDSISSDVAGRGVYETEYFVLREGDISRMVKPAKLSLQMGTLAVDSASEFQATLQAASVLGGLAGYADTTLLELPWDRSSAKTECDKLVADAEAKALDTQRRVDQEVATQPDLVALQRRIEAADARRKTSAGAEKLEAGKQFAARSKEYKATLEIRRTPLLKASSDAVAAAKSDREHRKAAYEGAPEYSEIDLATLISTAVP